MKPKQVALLAAVARTGNVTAAVRISHVGRSTHYGWLGDDPAYAAAYRDAMEQAADELELEARRRGLHGACKPVFHAGKQVMWKNPDTGEVEPYYEHEYSDQLLIKLLAAHRPEKYGTHRTELTGAARGPIRTNAERPFELRNISDGDLQTLVDIYDRANAKAE